MSLMPIVNRKDTKSIPRVSGIYLIQIGSVNYVGSSVNIRSRIWRHFNNLNKKVHVNPGLQNAFNKHQTFLFEILEIIESSHELLVKSEKEWYYKLKETCKMVNKDTFLPVKTCGRKPRVIADENAWKTKISNTIREEGICDGENNPFYGKKHTQENIERWREQQRQYVPTEETKEKMRLAMRGRKIDEEAISRRQMARTKDGKPYSTRCDFVGYNEEGIEVVRFKSIKDFQEQDYSKNPLYNSIKNKTPYKGLYWKKEI